jgi:predicted nucleic acid-binding protein
VIALVDTSVWIAHFRRSDPRLLTLLSRGEVFVHPAVIGELACGNLTRRDRVLSDFQKLPGAAIADHQETLFVIESHRLWGKGIGWADAQLVASALLTGCKLWTQDKRLHEVAAALHISY